MIPTEPALSEMERIRWTPDPETEAALKFVVEAITRPEKDGKSMLERCFLGVEYENQRAEEVRSAGFAILGKRFKDRAVWFHADVPDWGNCRFHLRLAKHAHELHKLQSATLDYNINLLRPFEEWVRPPKTELVLTKRAPTTIPAAKPKRTLPVRRK